LLTSTVIGEGAMSASELALDRCLRQLVRQGKRYGGYITYETVKKTLHHKRCDISLETLDWIYVRLTAEGIELVDQIPGKPVADVESQHNRGSRRYYRQRARARRRRPRHSSARYRGRNFALCPEAAIDNLLLRWEEVGLIRTEELLTVIKGCRFSVLEVHQLLEYLASKGVDLPDFGLSQPYDILREDTTVAEVHSMIAKQIVLALESNRIGGVSF